MSSLEYTSDYSSDLTTMVQGIHESVSNSSILQALEYAAQSTVDTQSNPGKYEVITTDSLSTQYSYTNQGFAHLDNESYSNNFSSILSDDENELYLVPTAYSIDQDNSRFTGEFNTYVSFLINLTSV